MASAVKICMSMYMCGHRRARRRRAFFWGGWLSALVRAPPGGTIEVARTRDRTSVDARGPHARSAARLSTRLTCTAKIGRLAAGFTCTAKYWPLGGRRGRVGNESGRERDTGCLASCRGALRAKMAHGREASACYHEHEMLIDNMRFSYLVSLPPSLSLEC